jgi:hypothetical protein
VASELEEIPDARRVASRFAGFEQIETAEKIARKKRDQNPLVAIADPAARAHPRQKDFQMEIREAPLDLFFLIDFGLDRIPAQSRFNL